jgi:transcriptional regulator with XRE-family HTH domain
MAQFQKDKVTLFLGAVRKYMQMRGPMNQRELAEATDTGVSTMSRFLNQQTQELNPNLIANITAKLNIPLHEIIDFVEEDYTDQFMRLVKFFKGEEGGQEAVIFEPDPEPDQDEPEEEAFLEALQDGGSQKTVKANIRVGNKTTPLAYQAQGEGDLREKLRKLSLKQKGFLNEFLNLDSDGKDLVADVGRNIITYLKQKGIDF